MNHVTTLQFNMVFNMIDVGDILKYAYVCGDMSEIGHTGKSP